MTGRTWKWLSKPEQVRGGIRVEAVAVAVAVDFGSRTRHRNITHRHPKVGNDITTERQPGRVRHASSIQTHPAHVGGDSQAPGGGHHAGDLADGRAGRILGNTPRQRATRFRRFHTATGGWGRPSAAGCPREPHRPAGGLRRRRPGEAHLGAGPQRRQPLDLVGPGQRRGRQMDRGGGNRRFGHHHRPRERPDLLVHGTGRRHHKRRASLVPMEQPSRVPGGRRRRHPAVHRHQRRGPSHLRRENRRDAGLLGQGRSWASHGAIRTVPVGQRRLRLLLRREERRAVGVLGQ